LENLEEMGKFLDTKFNQNYTKNLTSIIRKESKETINRLKKKIPGPYRCTAELYKTFEKKKKP
jgi:HD superfamily phosphohydrolase YqeK